MSRFDLTSLTTLDNYWPVLDEIREACPVSRSAGQSGFFMLSRFEDVVAAANDWRRFSSAQGINVVPLEKDSFLLPAEADPPYHSQLRRVLSPYFTAAAALAEEDFIRSIAMELIDGLLDRGECEFVDEFSLPFGGRVFFEGVLGAGSDDFRQANEWTMKTLADPQHAGSAFAEMAGYVRGLIERSEQSGANSLIQDLVRSEIDGQPLSVHELTNLVVFFVIAGPHTTKLTLANIMRHLATNQTLTERLGEEPTLIPAAIEEFLRLEPPAPLFGRVAACPIELHGEVISQGERVGLNFGAANRDPRVFDNADQLDITRAHNNHLAFGAGVHRCIGRHLARVELRVALEEILRRMPRFSIAPGAHVSLDTPMNYGPGTLPLVWTPPSS